MFLWILAALVLAVLGTAVFMRLVPDDAARWHVDPLTAPMPASPNAARLLPGEGAGSVAMAPGALAEALDARILAQPRTRRLARSDDGLWMTYVQRSRLMGYPDYISLRVVPEGEGARFAAFSRSRFGHSDLGVNAARLRDWFAGVGGG